MNSDEGLTMAERKAKVLAQYDESVGKILEAMDSINRKNERKCYVDTTRLMQLQDEEERRSRARQCPRINYMIRNVRRAGSRASASSRYSGSF